jgi:hypothetical protein
MDADSGEARPYQEREREREKLRLTVKRRDRVAGVQESPGRTVCRSHCAVRSRHPMIVIGETT